MCTYIGDKKKYSTPIHIVVVYVQKDIKQFRNSYKYGNLCLELFSNSLHSDWAIDQVLVI